MRLVHAKAGALKSVTSAVRAGAALCAVLALAVLGGCGGDEASSGKAALLEWKGDPRLLVPPTLPRDRILRGEIENAGLKKIKLVAADLRLLDAEGRQVEKAATFVQAYVHSLYPYGRGPGPGRSGYPEEEKRRLGLETELKPGQTVPLTVSWHEPRGPRTPVRIDYGSGSLEIPAKLRERNEGL